MLPLDDELTTVLPNLLTEPFCLAVAQNTTEFAKKIGSTIYMPDFLIPTRSRLSLSQPKNGLYGQPHLSKVKKPTVAQSELPRYRWHFPLQILEFCPFHQFNLILTQLCSPLAFRMLQTIQDHLHMPAQVSS